MISSSYTQLVKSHDIKSRMGMAIRDDDGERAGTRIGIGIGEGLDTGV